jgi:hypothetical protein
MVIPPPKAKWLFGEIRIKIAKRWFLLVSYDLASWLLGFGFDVCPIEFGLVFGPLGIGFERDGSEPYNYDDLPDLGFTLYRFVLPRRRLEIRIEIAVNRWSIGYSMADIHDHGIYLGPVNMQIEYDKFYDQPWPWPLEVTCDCPREQIQNTSVERN